MDERHLAPRLRRLPIALAGGREIRVASGLRARLLGLSRLDRFEVGTGLLIPRCASVHTFGMRFALDLHFLDGDATIVAVRCRVPARRVVCCRSAAAVLEIPSPEDWESGTQGGEISSVRP
jgi:uncharacterized protein